MNNKMLFWFIVTLLWRLVIVFTSATVLLWAGAIALGWI